MNCPLKDLGAVDLTDAHSKMCFISKLHADVIETILVLKV